MRRNFLFSLLTLLLCLVGGGSAWAADLSGWTKLTAMPATPADYYYVITTADDAFMMGLGYTGTDSKQQRYWTMAYQTAADPISDFTKVWTLENNSNGGYTIGNLRTADVICQTQSGAPWYFRVMTSTDVNLPEGSFNLSYADNAWKIQNGKAGGDNYVGKWDNMNVGDVVAANKSGNDIGTFSIYSMLRSDFEAAYKGTDVTRHYVKNPECEGTSGWTLTGDIGAQHNGEFTTGYLEIWEASTNRSISQDVNLLKVGLYSLTANLSARNTNSYITVKQGETVLGTKTLTNNEKTDVTVEFEVENIATPVTLLFTSDDANVRNHWFTLDNVRLNYFGNATGAVAAVYAEVKAKVDLLDAAGQAKFATLTADVKDAIDAASISSAQKDAFIATINAAYVPSVLAQTTPGIDMTTAILNPSFTNGVADWTVNNYGYNDWTMGGSKCLEEYREKGADFPEGSISQDINLEHSGIYTFKASLIARNWKESLVITQGASTKSFPVSSTPDEWQEATVTMPLDAGAVKIAATTPNGTTPADGNFWVAADNFRLTYEGSIEEFLDAVIADADAISSETKYNLDKKDDLETALTNATLKKYEGTAEEKYNAALALEKAVSDAKASIAEYAANNAILDEVESITNIFSFDGKDKLDQYKQDYEQELMDGALTRGSRVTGVLPELLLSAWNVNEGDYYINTWSTEGDKDGSNFRTPFYEYFVQDDKTLAAKELIATAEGLTPNTMYKVKAWTRVRATNGAAAPAGITLKAGNGTAVDVCAGTKIGTSQLFIGEYTALGETDEDGNLYITYSVAEGTNVSWLSFKNIFCEEAIEADLTALKAAIESAEAYTLGFEAGEYAPYTNADGAMALAAAKALTKYDAQADIDAAAAALNAATWTANAGEMNAIYDGTFSEYPYTRSGNEKAFAWTGDAGHDNATDVRHQWDGTTNPGLSAASSGEALFIKYGASYGKTAGYTMPLKANTAYMLTFKFGGWGENEGQVRDNTGKGITVTAPNGETIELTPVSTIQANKNGNSDASTWKTYTGAFATTEAGDYVLNFIHKSTAGQDQYVISDMELVKASDVAATISAGGYTTFCPIYFDVNVPAGVTAYAAQKDGSVVKLSEVSGALKQGEGYVLKGAAGATCYFTPTTGATAPEGNELVGVTEDKTLDQPYYALGVADGKCFFGPWDTSDIFPAGKAYLNSVASAAASKLEILVDDASAIAGVTTKAAKADDGKAYNLAGQTVSDTFRGIVIKNGKKVIK